MNEIQVDPRTTFRLTPRRLALVAFPLVLWLMATLALGGALGKSTDDYSTNLRDPATGTLVSGFRPFTEYNYFWRPAHLVLIHGLQTYLFEHDRLIHGLSAAAHGLVALLLFTLLRRFVRSDLLPASASLLFLAWPVIHEGSFFTSFISGPIASALWLWLAIATTRWASLPKRDRRVRGWLAPLCVIALAIPFFYEQPGAALLAWPLLVLAASPASLPWTTRLARALGLTFLLGLTQLGMAFAVVVTAPGSKRGSASSLARPEAWLDRSFDTLAAAADHLAGTPARQVLRGGFELGWQSMTASSLWVWLVPLGLTAFAWCLAIARTSRTPSDPSSQDHRGFAPNVWLLLFGMAAAATSLLPVALVSGQSVVPRLLYFPSIGLAIAAAAVGGLARAVISRRLGAVIAPPIAIAVALTAALGGITLVGIQKQYQQRSQADVAVAQSLKKLVPNPPADAVFVPLRIDHLPSRTGRLFFDRLRPGAFETIWSATAITRQTYHRRDLWAAGWNPWRLPLIEDPNRQNVRLNDRFVIWSPFAHDQPGGTRLPWSNVIPFVVEPSGRVRLVRRLAFEREDGSTLIIQPPIVQARLTAAPNASPLPRGDSTVFRAMLPFEETERARAQPLPAWTWKATIQPATPQPCRAWPGPGNTREAVWMHPAAASGSRSALQTSLAPADRPRRLVIRAAIAEYDLNRNAASDPVELTLLVNNQPAATATIRRARFRAEPTWMPLIASLPPSDSPLSLQLTLRPAAGSRIEQVLDPLWVTTGLVMPQEPDAPGVTQEDHGTDDPAP